MQRNQTHRSTVNDITIRGTAHHLVQKYEELASDAWIAKDITLQQKYLQQAEHYRKEIN